MESKVKLIGMTKPVDMDINGNPIYEPEWQEPMTSEGFIAYCARVSNPANQANSNTADKLLKYLVRKKHWSPFEMVHIVMDIQTTRDIGRQILRHRSFSFQEFSQRYAKAPDFSKPREARLQDIKNRQNSIEIDLNQNRNIIDDWEATQKRVLDVADIAYRWALENGIAKEQARVVLPEGLTITRMYMAGSLRSWIHYCELRMGPETQKEHREIAKECWKEIIEYIPSLKLLFDRDESKIVQS